jgi:ubiquinone/menaquinone biosynthesis C-methylase UbiE
MSDLAKQYSRRYGNDESAHLYPNEWIVRTLLGSYPNLKLEKAYQNRKILEVGFGDGRNLALLNNAGFEIFGTEIAPEIVEQAANRLARQSISATLEVGNNASLPFPGRFFDFILASFSWYYVDAGSTFDDNMREYSRVLKPGGTVLATLSESSTFILKDAVPGTGGHVTITSDVYGLRNGYIFKTFKDEDDIRECLSEYFEDIVIGKSINDYYGTMVSYYMVVCRNKS